jgi:hypothetical protein
VLSLLSRVCLSRAMALSSHSISAIIQYCYLYQHAPDTAKNHDANTACRTTSTCTNPCKLQVYKICYFATVVLLPPRVQVLRVVLLQPCPHATRYQSLLLLCSDWPVPRLCLLSPRCLSSSSPLSSDVTSTISYDYPFGEPDVQVVVRCVYRTVRVYEAWCLSAWSSRIICADTSCNSRYAWPGVTVLPCTHFLALQHTCTCTI